MIKIKLITVILSGILGLFLTFAPTPSLSAEPPKIVTYYVSEKGEFKQKLRWIMSNEEEWNRFESFTSRFRKSPRTFSPIEKNAAKSTPDMIVISDQNADLGTGRDYYLTQHGITIAERTPKHRFFRDDKNFYAFLKEQQKIAMRFYPNETSSNIPSDGLHIIFQITHELSNPSWLVTTPQDLSIYYDFLKDNQVVRDNKKSLQKMNAIFDNRNTFLVKILSKPSEYDVVSVAPEYLRFSKHVIAYRNLIDEKKYYQFYKSRALENIKNQIKNKQNDREKLKSQF